MMAHSDPPFKFSNEFKEQCDPLRAQKPHGSIKQIHLVIKYTD